VILAALLWFGLHQHSVAAPKETVKEYQVKAVYLYNFSHFIYWPDKLLEEKSQFYICVLGKNPFNNVLDYVASKEKFNDKPIKIKQFDNVKEIDECQILFISQSEKANLQSIFEQLDKHILTVSDIPDFIEQGGMIKFYTNRKNQVRLAIEPDKLREAGLQADANLLRISQIMSRK
jgi:hypothetical protein